MRTPMEIKRILAAARVPYPDILMDELEEAQNEVERLRKEIEEVHTYRKSMVKLMRDVTDILSMSNPASPDVALERIYRWLEENKPVGQEGEGNQDETV
ncbi:hypothetical protein [Paenibacillus xylanexedens]|uniref:hypothetical protein n=1 Tax=Paenibacillus xylanexedens TaxID=528191 RepID=UPI00119F1722|nr:hypothetical protein [Paenibacillus xylanexedens]